MHQTGGHFNSAGLCTWWAGQASYVDWTSHIGRLLHPFNRENFRGYNPGANRRSDAPSQPGMTVDASLIACTRCRTCRTRREADNVAWAALERSSRPSSEAAASELCAENFQALPFAYQVVGHALGRLPKVPGRWQRRIGALVKPPLAILCGRGQRRLQTPQVRHDGVFDVSD